MAISDKQKYPALKIIAAWYKAFGFLVGGIILLAGIAAILKGGSGSVGVGLVIGAIVFVILSVSIAEIIQLFLDSESNTRQAADHLKQLVDLNAKPDPAKRKTPPESPPKTPQKPVAGPAAQPRKANGSQAESIIVLIKSLFDDGLSPESIAEELRSEGLPTLSGEVAWTEPQVAAVLRRPSK